MPEYSSRDARTAGIVMEQIIAGQRADLPLPRDVAISDVEAHTDQFLDEVELVERFETGMPCVATEKGLVPISLRALRPEFNLLPSLRRGDDDRKGVVSELFRYFLRDLRREHRRDDSVEFKEPNDARGMFYRGAVDFLATRFAGVREIKEGSGSRGNEPGFVRSFLRLRQQRGGPSISTPGCTFTVTADTSGLRVFWSGAYFITPNNFGYPTNPTTSVLQSGTYIFGVDGGAYGNNVQWDLNAISALPGPTSMHLNY